APQHEGDQRLRDTGQVGHITDRRRSHGYGPFHALRRLVKGLTASEYGTQGDLDRIWTGPKRGCQSWWTRSASPSSVSAGWGGCTPRRTPVSRTTTHGSPCVRSS